MSETKRCPMMFCQGGGGPYRTYCIQEKCAWYVEEVREIVSIDGETIKEAIPGHCAALDWGKR